MAAIEIINPIKDAMVTLFKAKAAALGIKTVEKDLSLDTISDDVEKLAAVMPAVIIIYYGRTARAEGTTLMTAMTYAVVIAARSLKDAHASDPIATSLLDACLELLQGKNILSSVQRSGFTLTAETLQHKDKVLTIYQQLYNTDVALDFRDALNPLSP